MTETPTRTTPISDSISLEQPKEWLHIYTITSMRHEAIQQLIASVAGVIEKCPANQPCHLLYDMSQVNYFKLPQTAVKLVGLDVRTIGITMEGNGIILHTLAARPYLKVSLAVVINPKVSVRTIALIKHTSMLPHPYITKVFAARPGALSWLEAQI